MDTDAQTIDTTRRGIGRRTVVKGAVATAWTVPLVQVVAAPAFATSVSAAADLSTTTGSVTFGPVNKTTGAATFTATATITNTGGTTTAGLVATVSWSPKNKNSGTMGSLKTPTGQATWSGSGPSWTASKQIAPRGSQTFTLTGTVVAGKSLNGTLTVTFAAGSGTGAVAGGISGSV